MPRAAARHSGPIADDVGVVERTFADEDLRCAFCDDLVEENQPVVAIRDAGEIHDAGDRETLVSKPSTTFVCMLCALESDDEELREAARS